MSKRKTREQFISDAIAVHGDKYDYSKVEYINNRTKVCIICSTHGAFWQIPIDHIRGNGCLKCAKERFFGINDIPYPHDYRSYSYWQGLINRCYQQKTNPKNHSYSDCAICKEWLTFSNFKKWFENPVNGYIPCYQIDKDILQKGNKIYSPDTCCFLPKELNQVFIRHYKRRGDLPIGVRKLRSGRYYCSVRKHSKNDYIGSYNTPEEAFNAYKIAKEQYIKELADKYFKEGKITQRVYDALMKYEVEITD